MAFSTRNPFCRWLTLLSVMAISGGLTGCGGSGNTLKLTPVTGKVTVDGKELPGAGVSFRADTTKGNDTQHIPTGTCNEVGEYELMTGGEKGAPAGWYKVAVFPPTPPSTGGEMPAAVPPPFDPKYLDPNASELSIEVKQGASPDAYDLKLKK